MSIVQNIKDIEIELENTGAKLIPVSKTKPAELLLEAYNAGYKIFGENYVQELVDKYEQMPKDIEWHMIGHLQSNKVKYIAPFVSLIHSVDSAKLLQEINKQALKNNRIIKCLLQVHIATEDTKSGFDTSEIVAFVTSDVIESLKNVEIIGLMGMSTLAKGIRATLKNGGNIKAAELLGEVFGKDAIDKGYRKVAFDRGGYKYHGRVKAFADAARKVGLEF